MNHKIKLLCCSLLLGLASVASSEENWQAEILGITRTFSELAQKQDVMDYSLRHMHEQVLGAVANQLGQTNNEALQTMRAGYASSRDALEVFSHNIFPQNAQFGDTEGWKWGAVPYGSQMRFRSNGGELPSSCSWLLVFEDNERWFFNSAHSGSAKTRTLLASGLPGPMAEIVNELEPPQCDP